MSQPRVLVVDDDSLVSWALGKALSTQPLLVDTAATASEGLAFVRERSYDIAFLDIQLPDGDGLDLLPAFRALAPRTRFVMLSCAGSEGNRQRAFEGGAWQFVAKPFELSEVMGLVKSAFGEHPVRRRCERRLCRLPLRVALVGPDSGRPVDGGVEFVDATALDVGTGGLRLRTDYPLQPGMWVKVSAAEGDCFCANLLRQHVAAEVVWVVPGGDEVTAGLRYPD